LPSAHPRQRRAISPITWRILSLNVLALAILVAGLLYLGQYRSGLIDAEMDSLTTQAQIFAGALAEGAVGTGDDGTQSIRAAVARSMLRRLVQPTDSRARLFDAQGNMVADSRQLGGPGNVVQVEVLQGADEDDSLTAQSIFTIYEQLANWITGAPEPEPYFEKPIQRAFDYDEAVIALNGESAGAVRVLPSGRQVISAAVPVQRFKQVMGVVMLTTTSASVDRAVAEVRIGILRVFGVALAVTVLVSFYLAGTIARPMRRLAAAAEQVRRGQGRGQTLPDFTSRHDEIGDLSGALREMTEALWLRMDAIESFAADVAHEIKNPLTSLRSAVETAARVTNPEQQRRLMTIIQDDVKRLDRLITDISDASRLDAALSREVMERVDLGQLVDALVSVRRETGEEETAPGLRYEGDGTGVLMVRGIEGRLAQVFNNLISNAISFSPPGGAVVVRGARVDGQAQFTVEDDGPGIPEGSEERIFERFYSERPESEKFGTHSGLGLSISRQIVSAHGGRIWAENRRAPDGTIRGARFTVRLPAN
jgi:two-component system sensor histidine kinase ChvG